MARMTKEKVGKVVELLSNDYSSSDAELILNIAKFLGKPIIKCSKLVKEKRDYFLTGCALDAHKMVRKYMYAPVPSF